MQKKKSVKRIKNNFNVL